MIYVEKGKIEQEKNEPLLNICWECNPDNGHLKKVNMLHRCTHCKRYWIFYTYLDHFGSDSAVADHLERRGLMPGESTSKINIIFSKSI